MSQHCIKCHEKFSAKEQKELDAEAEFCEVRYICSECFQMESNNEPTDESFSDADPGL